jgi:hypothetical protein
MLQNCPMNIKPIGRYFRCCARAPRREMSRPSQGFLGMTSRSRAAYFSKDLIQVNRSLDVLLVATLVNNHALNESPCARVRVTRSTFFPRHSSNRATARRQAETESSERFLLTFHRSWTILSVSGAAVAALVAPGGAWMVIEDGEGGGAAWGLSATG